MKLCDPVFFNHLSLPLRGAYTIAAACLLPLVANSAQLAEFVWSGGISPTSAEVRAGLLTDSSNVRLVVSTASNLSNPTYSSSVDATAAANDRVAPLTISGLQPDTSYYYAVEVDGVLDDLRGAFRTFPSGNASFTFSFGSCANTGSTHPVLDQIRSENPLFHLVTGDFFYEDIGVNDPELFRDAYRANFASPQWAALMQHAPFAYIWDDHDFGPNNSNSSSAAKPAAQSVYREMVPHYTLPDSSSIYQAFSVGRVRVILLDLRSERDVQSATDNAQKSTLGAAQKAWLKEELLQAQREGAVSILVSSVPWISDRGSDTWDSYSTERSELARFIVENSLQDSLFMLGGDAHMLAIDDGRNNTYANAGFPVFHAAALDRSGSTKGGPYSHGTFPGPGQYGLVEVTDKGGDTIKVSWIGKNAANEVVTEYSFDVPVPQSTSTAVHSGS